MSDVSKYNSPATPREDDDSLFADSPQLISAALPATASKFLDDVDDDDGLEFSFVVGKKETHPSITADEIFSEGQIRPIYPVFNRDLLFADGEEKLCRRPLLHLLAEDRNASISHTSSSLGNNLKGISPGNYCVWKPGSAESPETVRKSSSTGSSRGQRIMDFVVGRSHSDGREKFFFFPSEEKSSIVKQVAANEEKKKGKEKKTTELDMITAHRMFYGQSGNGSTAGSGSTAGRKTYLPYKPVVLGFFGNSRAQHPI